MIRSLDTEQRRNAYRRGRWAEQAALAYLQDRGLSLLRRNYRSPYGEIDLIMRDADIMVLIEVRYRARNHVVSAVETVDAAKCQRIFNSSEHYLQKHRHAAGLQRRLDVVIITGPEDNHAIEWLPHVHEI